MLRRDLVRRISRVTSSFVRGQTYATETDCKPFQDIPGPKGIYQWPLIGTMLLFKPFTEFTAETVHKLIDSMFDRYGPVVRLQLGREMVMVSDVRDIETVFRREGKYPNRPPIELVEVLFERNGYKKSIMIEQGENWYKLRSAVNKRLMKADSASHYLEPQNLVADDFVQILANQKLEPEQLSDLFYRYASESIGVVTFNKRLGFMDGSADKEEREFLEASKVAFEQIHMSMSGKSVLHKFYRNKTYRTFEQAIWVMKRNSSAHAAKAREIIKQKEKEGTLNPEEPNLLLSLASEKNFSDEDVSNMIDSLYTAGTDSTAKNLQAIFFNLARNPEKQELLRQEVDRVIGPDKPLTAKALTEMVYLKACVKESFRLLFPTLSGTGRVLPVDVVLGGYRVPAGTFIILGNPRASKVYFDEPDNFIPERWLRSGPSHKQDSTQTLAVLPFGHGPRNCIGQRFATQEMYLATAKVLQKLKIELEPESWNTEFVYRVFIDPKVPLKFKFSPVQQA
ncbi:probable cytochrome P450 12a5, mitochondrial [Physella acuta]|uniref:probable cytochrome P450 12a5, mitochondrial n=1 Tax=Physella acuta TaxID=109671 RepID=UPI0027DBA32D|nr:probable cytochrome P450 12a5, mitochondrial [Physella acuta]XP_059155797.1 probable cytochrome P450 12a5, mitochondrial [Physella acuta]XP_059155798.1 probable cytochrome P450 12a5, mitochondrial [Physella acuta]